MGADQSTGKRSCMPDEKPDPSKKNMLPDRPQQSKKAQLLKKRGTEIEKAGEGDEEEVDSADEERERRRRRRKGMQEPDPAELKRKNRKEREGSSGSGSGSSSEGEVPGAPLNFNRDYEVPVNVAVPADAENDMAVEMIDDEKYEDIVSGPGRSRQKGGRGVGDPLSPKAGNGIGIGQDLDEIDAEELRAFAFKTSSAVASENRLEFEYELPELAERLGTSLKILTAGFDEAVMFVPQNRYTQTYKAYNLNASNLGGQFHGLVDSNEQFGPNGTRRPSVAHMLLDESQNFGAEYKAAEKDFTADELLLQKAAGNRRRRKIMRELHWQKQKKEAKAAERLAQMKKDESERSQTSKSGFSYTRQKSITNNNHSAMASRRQSVGPASARGPGRPAFGRASTLGNNTKPPGLMSPGGNNRSSLGMSPMSGFASPMGGMGSPMNGGVRRSLITGGSTMASPRG